MTAFPSLLFRHSLARFVLLTCMMCFLMLPTSRGHPFILSPVRGGTAFSQSQNQNKENLYVESTVGVLTVGEVVGDDNNQHIDSIWLADTNNDYCSSCVMLNGEGEVTSRISNLPQDDPMVQSLAFLCDAVVVFLKLPPCNDDLVASLVSPLIQGAKKRLEARGTRGRLVIVLPFAKEEDQSPMMENLILRQFANIVPNEWSTFDIISKNELDKHLLREILNEKNGQIRNIFPEDEDNTQFFSKVLQKVYQMEGGEVGKEFEIHNLPLVDKHAGNKSHRPAPIADKAVVDKDQDSQMQDILIRCHVQLEAMESKLQDVLLNDQEKRLPLLEFGAMANALLNQTIADLEQLPSNFYLAILTPVLSELQRLYRDHLQTIRDYYGKRYERILEESNEESEWTSSAEHFMQGFQAAASNSVPSVCRPNEVLAEWANAFDSTKSLQGLISDMLEATQIRKDEQSLAVESEDDFQEQGTLGRFHRVPRWLKKLAGRALVLGVNYIQGWLAWQGVKRAAIERDLSMPKFPLF